MSAIKNRSEFPFVVFDLFAFTVTVEIALFSVVRLAMGLVVHGPTHCSPFVADSLALQHFQFDFFPLTRLERYGDLGRLQSRS